MILSIFVLFLEDGITILAYGGNFKEKKTVLPAKKYEVFRPSRSFALDFSAGNCYLYRKSKISYIEQE